MANPHYPTSTLERPAERLLKPFKTSRGRQRHDPHLSAAWVASPVVV
ncbi:MAG TPA: hypothetical protein VFE10_14080 [Phenylobacterium sp.]|nr:hypothetical protein [Phenylobacterium sp.]